ncbi:hypothetical protein K8I61_16015, partial [bacterium]|nr:hypothetical protein [bacterium]
WDAQTGGGGDLRPNTGATVSQNFELQHNHIVGGPFDPSLVYEYMVAGVTANAGASALPVDTSSTPWSFGASCVEEGRFDCPCPGDWATSDVEYCSLRNTTVNDTGDAITVSWTWDEAAGQVPPAGATVRLVTRDINTATSDWGEVDTVIAPPQDPSSCGTSTTAPCVGFHRHEDMCWGQLNVYGLLIECVDEDVPVCNRILNLGVIESPGAPDQAHVCFETQHPPGTPDCNSYTGANCQTGQVEIALRDVMANCSTQITTSESYMWWRAVRYSTNTYDPFTGDPVFPVEPDNGSYECVKSDPSCTGTCSTVDNPPGQCFGTFHYTGYWMRLGENLAALQGANGYSYPAYAATGVNLKQVENVAGRRSYVFSEYVNPALSYKYIFSVLVEQNGGATTRPNCTGDYYECGDTCNGGFDGLEEFQVIVDFANKSQCYPQISGQGAGNASTPNTRPPNATAGTWDNFNWTGAGEELESSDKPWMSDEISILGLTNEYTWEYSGSYIRSDLDGFFGTILSWLLGEIGDFFFSLCGDCILDIFGFCIIDMDALWPDCEQDTTELANHNFAWSNFFAPVCGSNGPGSGHYFDGDYMVHYHFRVNQEDRTLHAAYRGRYTPWQNSFNLLQLEFDMNGGGGQVCGQLSFRSGTQFQDVSSPTCIASGDESFDDEWFANFTLICTNRVAGAFNEDETYAFTWSTIDPAKTKDWKPEMLTTPPTLSWTTHTRTLSAAIAPVEKAMEGTSMPQGCSSHCSVTGNGYSCNANAPLRCVIYQDGKFGFWANPEVDFESTEYQYDNVRIDPYCGQCPPSFLATSAMSAESAARTDTNLKAGHIKEYGQRHRK